MITVRVWDDGHKEIVHKDAMEFERVSGKLGSKNVRYVPENREADLTAALKVLVESNGFYSDYTHWEEIECDCRSERMTFTEDDEDTPIEISPYEWRGGKKARLAQNSPELKKVKGLLK